MDGIVQLDVEYQKESSLRYVPRYELRCRYHDFNGLLIDLNNSSSVSLSLLSQLFCCYNTPFN